MVLQCFSIIILRIFENLLENCWLLILKDPLDECLKIAVTTLIFFRSVTLTVRQVNYLWETVDFCGKFITDHYYLRHSVMGPFVLYSHLHKTLLQIRASSFFYLMRLLYHNHQLLIIFTLAMSMNNWKWSYRIVVR